MRLKASTFFFARLFTLVFLVWSGSLPASGTVYSAGPDEPSVPVLLGRTIDFGPSGSRDSTRGAGRSSGKVESLLSQLVYEAANSGQGLALAQAGKMGVTTKDDGVLVVVEGTDGSAERVKEALEARRGSVTASSGDLVQAFLPLPAIGDVAAMPEVKVVRRPIVPKADQTSEGLGVINAPAWQTAGLNGSGVKIGIIDVGFANYTSLLGTELPPPGRIFVQSFRADGDITGGDEIHGTACVEIIYDIAPAATYYLANVSTDVEFGAAVDWMIANGVKIVSASIGMVGANNYDGTGFVDNKVNAARAAGIFWAASSGNYAKQHWGGTFYDPENDGFHNFSGSNIGNGVTVNAGWPIVGVLTWNNSWSSPTDDYDLYLARSNGQIVAGSNNYQTDGYPPVEQLAWTADQPGTYFFVMVKYSGVARNLQLYSTQEDLYYRIASSSLAAPADAAGAVAVGAFNYATGGIEDFSSQGPTTDGRTKPDLSAPDRVSTTTYGPTGFPGTSAAAPHVAGAAALVKQANPSYTPAQIQSFLEGRAIDAGGLGKDNIYGTGKLYLGAAPPPSLAIGATSLYFLADAQGTSGTQQVPIANGGWGSLNWTAMEWDASPHDFPWLSLSPASGTAPSTLQVAVDRSQVVSGTTVTGQIKIEGTSPSTLNTPQYISVTFKHSAVPLTRLYTPFVAKSYGGSW